MKLTGFNRRNFFLNAARTSMTIYARLGPRSIINAFGNYTDLRGSPLPAEVIHPGAAPNRLRGLTWTIPFTRGTRMGMAY